MPIIDPSKNVSLAIGHEPELTDTLKGLLKREKLLKFCDDFRFYHQQSWNKTLLAECIEFNLINKPEVLAERLPLSALLELRDLVKAGGKLRRTAPMSFWYLSLRGLIAYEVTETGKKPDLCILPKKFCTALEPVIETMVQKEALKIWDKRERLFCGLLQCYGVMEGRLLMEKYKAASGETVSLEEFFCFLRLRDRFYEEIKLVGMWSGKHFFASVDVGYPQLIYDQTKRRKDLDYYQFTEKELLEAGNIFPVPDSIATRKLIKGLTKNGIAREKAFEMLHSAVLLIRNDADMAELLDLFFGEITLNTITKFNNFVELIMDFQNSLPKWSLKGHSSAELFEKERKYLKPLPKEPFNLGTVSRMSNAGNSDSKFGQTLPKVGRNDPCPCGSGKKYKKCCGNE